MAFTKEIVDFSQLDNIEVQKKLEEFHIPLTPEEALKIQNEMLGRAPSLAELVLFSIQGSEHCSYKSSRKHLKQFTTEGPDVVLGAKEDAGVVAITQDNSGKRWCIVMSHESHNHPSQIVPYEGAATGVGGNVRDVMCMGAEVIACTDSFRFGEIKRNKTKWIHDGVVSGVASYGNPLGVPNIGGDVYYHKGYNENCLVTLVTLGIIREDHVIHSYAPKNANGHDLILIGKPTDNSGFGGASFASLELEENEKEKNKGAVQEPNAFLERHLLKSTYALFKILREKNLVNQVGFKDLGAGGVACASVELAETSGYGSEIWMEKIHIGLENLHPSVYLCSETQERFMWVCPPEITTTIVDHYNKSFDLPTVSSGAKASVIGKIRDDGMYVVHNGEEEIVNAPASEVTKGFLYDRPYKKTQASHSEPKIEEPSNLNKVLLRVLAHENVCSRTPVYEKYDKQVQGRTYIETGLADAGVMAPFNSSEFPKEIRNVGIALSTDNNPLHGLINPYLSGINAVVEAMRNVASVGATPHAITDCLCYGNPEKPEQMWQFSQSCVAIREACSLLHFNGTDNLPIVAGNVSFYNQSGDQSIPASPMIGCFGKVSKEQVLMNGFRSSDANIYLVGETPAFIGGSIVVDVLNIKNTKVKKIDVQKYSNMLSCVLKANSEGLVSSGSYVGLGGLATCLFKMGFVNNVGCSIDKDIDKNLLFSENFAFVVEVSEESSAAFEEILNKSKCTYKQIGKTNKSSKIVVKNFIDLDVAQTKRTWENALREKLQ